MQDFSPDSKTQRFTRSAIIGLGEDSFRKNYYPELQEKIRVLEQTKARSEALLASIQDILLVSDENSVIQPAAVHHDTEYNDVNKKLSALIFETPTVMNHLAAGVKIALRTGAVNDDFIIETENITHYFEARFTLSKTGEVLIMIRDMTSQKELEKKLIELTERDVLTVLHNRRWFERQLILYNGKPHASLTLVIITLNGLKFINDTLGHTAGDRIICSAAELINTVFADAGNTARIGGDEFGIIIENSMPEDVEKLLHILNEKAEQVPKHEIPDAVSFSSGYSFHHEGYVRTELMYQEADANMFQNKLVKKQSVRSKFVTTFMKTLEAKDFVSEGHVSRMETLAVLIGRKMNLRQVQIDQLMLLTKFHDIGKIGIPDNILKKPGTLTNAEWKVMRTHTTIGERIAIEANEIKEIAHLILKHHERWDGNGYPLGLLGQNIPIECRILAVVDTYDAITNDRPYSKARTSEEAAAEIQRCSGTQFDPAVVEIFLDCINKQPR